MLLLLRCWVAAASGDPGQAERLAAAAGGLWKLIGTQIAALGPHLAAEDASRTPKVAGAPRSISLAEAIRLGLEYMVAGPATVLTPRERDVLAFLVKGRSNRAIADALVISARTAEGHVQNILTKLGLASRNEVPAWFIAHGQGMAPLT